MIIFTFMAHNFGKVIKIIIDAVFFWDADYADWLWFFFHLLGSCLHETKINLDADLRWKTKEKYWRWLTLIDYFFWRWFTLIGYDLFVIKYTTWQELRNLSGCVPSPWFVSSRNKNKLWRWFTLKNKRKILTLIYPVR